METAGGWLEYGGVRKERFSALSRWRLRLSEDIKEHAQCHERFDDIIIIRSELMAEIQQSRRDIFHGRHVGAQAAS